MPASAASTGPRSEVSSQGWTTTVIAAGTCFARAISSLVFAVGRMRHWADRRDITDLAAKRHDYPRSLQCGVSGVRS